MFIFIQDGELMKKKIASRSKREIKKKVVKSSKFNKIKNQQVPKTNRKSKNKNFIYLFIYVIGKFSEDTFGHQTQKRNDQKMY